MFLELQKMFLRLSAVHVLTARDGSEALTIARTERPGLIFMDLHMPTMNGAECCARLKGEPTLRSVPVVMITSEGKEEDRALCYRAGCDDFLTKPIDRNLYLEKARKFLPAIDRRDTRVPCRATVKFKVFGVTLSGEVLNVSANGAYVATGHEVGVGTVLELAFALPDGSGSLVQARGKVAWLNRRQAKLKQGLPEGFGIEFTAITEASKRALRQFVESQN